MISALQRILRSLPRRRKVQLVLLLGFMVIAAAAELLSLGAIIPFLAMLADPSLVVSRLTGTPFAGWLNLSDPAALRFQLTALFVGAVLLSGAIRLGLSSATARVNFGIGHDIGVEAFRRTLDQPYRVHVARNSAEILGGITKVDQTVFTFYSLLLMVSSLIVASCILAALLWINFRVALAVMVAFGLIYGVISFFTRRRLARNSQVVNDAYARRVQILQEGLGGIRDVLLDHSQGVFLDRFLRLDAGMRRAQASNNIIGPAPRFIIETAGMALIALLAFALTRSQESFATALPVLGALALGAQRLIPLLQQAYQSWVMTASSKHLLADVADLIQQPLPEAVPANAAPIRFEREIAVRELSFRYTPEAPLVLDGINLRITKGMRVGFIGATGSGKSTLIDLLMGLLSPTSGTIEIDGAPLSDATRAAWTRHIAHVPQAIYLADASFTENIAFAVPREEIDLARVQAAARQAQIADFIAASPRGYDTFVGERGVRLSGGQRQRIGIARALYKHASVLVFDEATSALDHETEQSVIEAIEGLGRDLTIIMIAHRVSTLRSCDVVHRIERGRSVASGPFAIVANIPGVEMAPLPHA